MKRDQPEFKLTVAVADLLRRTAMPGLYFTHLPFGEARSEKTGARLKRMGTRAGAPDFLLLRCGMCIGLELKTEKGRQTETQKATQADWEKAGGHYVLVHSYQEAVSFLERFGLIRKDHSLIRNSEAA
jgi:hypothetical protein